MFTLLENHRFLAVVGASGSGKSSLVRAGLLPRLSSVGLLTQRPGPWHVVITKPGNAPIANLSQALHSPDGVTGKMPPTELHGGDVQMTQVVLESGPLGFLEAIGDARIPEDDNVLLVVDQFEEVFRFRTGKDEDRLESDWLRADLARWERRNESIQFVTLLLETSRQERRPIYVMLTMRSDYLGECDVFNGLPQAINAGQYLTPRLNHRQLEEAIRGPLGVARCRADIEPQLVDRMLMEASSDRDQLPLLQHALLRTWLCAKEAEPQANGLVCLTLENYEKIGGVKNALSLHAYEVFRGCEERGLARVVERLFRSLIQRGPTGQLVRCAATIERLIAESECKKDEIKAVVEEFRRADRSFLTPAASQALTESDVIDISHESLVRHWAILREKWLPAWEGSTRQHGKGVIFISHSTKDKHAAYDLQHRLLQRGYDASQLFLDSETESGIPAGSEWEKVLYERLKDSRAVIVLCSANWQQSKWCFSEITYAKAMGKEIFPVLLEPCDLGGALADRQAVSIYEDGDVAYDRLCHALESRYLGPQDFFGWNPSDCPFPGLLAFDEKHAGVFFGREPETQNVLEELRKMRTYGEPRLLMIVGGSGSGKSSLLKAGVLPRLKRRVQATDWLVLPTLRFGESLNDACTLFNQLARNLAMLFPADTSYALDWKSLRDRFAQEDADEAANLFCNVAQELTHARACGDATVLLVVDQFEELLSPSAGPSANRFLRFLQVVLLRRNGRLLALGTMRSNYLDIYEQNPHAPTTPFFQSWRLGPLPRDRLGDVIVRPAALVHVEVTGELVERLKHDTPSADALPLLAFTLEVLFRRYAGDGVLDVRQYDELGGMEGAILSTVNRTLSDGSLSSEAKDALRMCFVKHLARLNDNGEIVRLTARWSDLPDAAKPMLQRFINERLLVTIGREQQVYVEVAHEAIFRCWDLLAEWLRTSADILRWRREVRRDQESDKNWAGLRSAQLAVARDWPRQRSSELTADELTWIRRALRRQWLLQAALASVVLLMACLSMVAWHQKASADRAKTDLQSAKELFEFRQKMIEDGLKNAKTSLSRIDDSRLSQDEREALWEAVRRLEDTTHLHWPEN